MKLDFRKDFQPEVGDPEENPECPEGFPARRWRFSRQTELKPHALRAGGTVAGIYIYIYICLRILHILSYSLDVAPGAICLAESAAPPNPSMAS